MLENRPSFSVARFWPDFQGTGEEMEHVASVDAVGLSTQASGTHTVFGNAVEKEEILSPLL